MVATVVVAPTEAEFWRLRRTAGARLIMKDGAAAGIAPGMRPSGKTSVAGRHSAVNHSRRKLKGRELRRFLAVRKDLPAHAISTKNKHLLVIYSIPTRGFTAALSVFWGHTSSEALSL
jgi:hypothetical protein